MASGLKLETQYLKLFIKKGENSNSQMGIAVSAKAFKKAHERNRARRLVSRAFEQLYDRIAGNLNIVAMPKSNILKATSKEVVDDLGRLLKKMGLVKS